MKQDAPMTDTELATIKKRRAAFRTISAVEGIKYSQDDEALFAMFDRERWSHARRLDFLKSRARANS